MNDFIARILEINRNPKLNDWFMETLAELVSYGLYQNSATDITAKLTSELAKYRIANNIDKVVVGMSGGIDSAVTAALYHRAGWEVEGVLMPINQKEEETKRGIEVCKSLGIKHRIRVLDSEFAFLLERMAKSHGGLAENKIRQGNIRARLRMMTLYDLAAEAGGLVASTDNFSELAAGFWTLHGDVGDLAPIQSLTKSWEVPILGEHLQIPKSVLTAVPTDGLGISNSDEEQFGFSYLEFDIALFKLMGGGVDMTELDESTQRIIKDVARRVRQTAHKRSNPHNLQHPWDYGRYEMLQALDNYLKKEI